jgi:ABC-type nitrate/sulfonate/bicarbonate transport system ATPase subunit
MTKIALRGVQKWFGPNQVIKDMNLGVEQGEFIVMLGQSGCGKTTTLRAIAGLETIDEGDILIDGRPVQHLKAADRDIAFVFQSFSLYPHMTVYETSPFPCAPPVCAAARSTGRCGRWPTSCASRPCLPSAHRRSRAATCSGWRSAGRWCGAPRRC